MAERRDAESDRYAGAKDSSQFVVDRRFCGPPRSGNGGYVAGRIAAFANRPAADTAVEVTLRSPPPLGTRLDVSHVDGELQVHNQEILVAQAQLSVMTARVPASVPFEDAVEAAERYAGRRNHPFPTCFVCGLDRARGDALRLQPGSVGESLVAAAWQPHESLATDEQVAEEFVWAALDCPGGWAAGFDGRPMVLGRMTGRVLSTPRVGQRCVIVGQVRSVEGRKAFTATALYSDAGELFAHAEATWLTVDPASVRPQT